MQMINQKNQSKKIELNIKDDKLIFSKTLFWNVLL